jgi:tRNA pseudouridine55 synthase
VTDGVVLYDKPAGVTSHDVVAVMRRSLRARFAGGRFAGGRDAGGGDAGGRDARPGAAGASGVGAAGRHRLKVGHAGTLDPFATGLLLVLVGRATRVQRFLLELPKTYEVVARFGAVSSTGDPEGEIVATGNVPDGAVVLPIGRVRQRPPAFSAVKVGGRRAYALARAGEAVELAERDVEVYRFRERWHDGVRRGFEVECSSGTYVRSLITDLGDAYCEELRRTRIGPFSVEDADPERIVPLEDALSFMPEVRLDPEQVLRATHGGAVAGQAGTAHVVRLTDERGLVALAAPRETGKLAPVVGLRG